MRSTWTRRGWFWRRGRRQSRRCVLPEPAVGNLWPQPAEHAPCSRPQYSTAAAATHRRAACLRLRLRVQAELLGEWQAPLKGLAEHTNPRRDKDKVPTTAHTHPRAHAPALCSAHRPSRRRARLLPPWPARTRTHLFSAPLPRVRVGRRRPSADADGNFRLGSGGLSV
jgi:hypothetical protein